MPLRIPDAVDLHCHYGPDTIEASLHAQSHHSVSAVEAAREASMSGHAALVLKSHTFASPALAANLEECVPGVRILGGVCTDYYSGGLNLEGIESALALGAKIVWLPTVHSREDFDRLAAVFGRPRGHSEGIAVTDEAGRPLDAVHEIFEMVRQKDAVLATGHITAAEHYSVVRECARRGKVLVTHAGEPLAGPALDVHQCVELAELGATIEISAQLCKELPVYGKHAMSPNEVSRMIRTIEPARVTLCSDYGWSELMPHPAAGLREFFELLWTEGEITEAELRMMASANPARLVDLEL